MSKATIYYHDIGDYLSREDKLEILHKMGSIENPAMQWEILHHNKHNDWINQRNEGFNEQFASDLKKQLPRIPLLDDSVDFWKYVKAGRELADLHLHYEDHADEFPVTVELGTANYEVTKMRFPSKGDKSRIIYNPFITISDIPAEAYEYVVNGKSAIEWVMERYQVTTNKDSGIVNDPNDWAREHNQPRYILDLLRSVIAISLRTVEIVKNLPKVKL
jgi:predicted helicase